LGQSKTDKKLEYITYSYKSGRMLTIKNEKQKFRNTRDPYCFD
jgi:hypothetical protein